MGNFCTHVAPNFHWFAQTRTLTPKKLACMEVLPSVLLFCAFAGSRSSTVPLFQLLQTHSSSRPKAVDCLNVYQRCQNASLLIRTGLIRGSQRRGGQVPSHGPTGSDPFHQSCGPLAAILPLFPRRSQLPIPLNRCNLLWVSRASNTSTEEHRPARSMSSTLIPRHNPAR